MFLLRRVLLAIAAVIGGSSGVLAADDWSSSVHILQVSNKPKSLEKGGEKEKEVLWNEQNILAGQKMDYQAEVINNPKFTDYGRAKDAIAQNEAAIPASGANTVAIKQDSNVKSLSEDQLEKNIAIIHQEGSGNTSTVVQSGKNNKVVHTQKGIKNDLSVTQTGEHNESYEEQIGKFNHKKKVQNGIVTEVEELK